MAPERRTSPRDDGAPLLHLRPGLRPLCGLQPRRVERGHLHASAHAVLLPAAEPTPQRLRRVTMTIAADFFVYDPEGDISWYATEAEARARAEAILEEERDHSPDGWRE